jgi:hypothetical protein
LASETVDVDEDGLTYDEVQILLRKLIGQSEPNSFDSDFAKKVAPYRSDINKKASALYEAIDALSDMIEVERRANCEEASANREENPEAPENPEQKLDNAKLSEKSGSVKIELDNLKN